MPPKRPASSKVSGKESKRQKKVMTLQEKVALLDMLKEMKSYAAVARQYHMNESTIRYIKKKEAEIRKTVSISFSSSAKTVSTVRDSAIVKMESALSLWITDCYKKNIPLDGNVIRKKARCLFEKLAPEGEAQQREDAKVFKEEKEDKEGAGPSTGAPAPKAGFVASNGWFHRFQNRFQLKGMTLHGQMASADTEEARKYPEMLKKIIVENNYHPEQVSNMDETSRFWRKMPSHTYLMKDEAPAPGFKSASEDEDTQPDEEEDEGLSLDRLSLLLRTLKEAREMVRAWDPYMDRSIKFNNAIDACSKPYKILFNLLRKEVQQLPITMFFQPVRKTSEKPPEIPKMLP